MKDHLERLLTRIKEDSDPVWTQERVQGLLGPDSSSDTCDRLLRRVERMRVLVQREDGTWVRALWPGCAQRSNEALNS
jgi:hypothetical protein